MAVQEQVLGVGVKQEALLEADRLGPPVGLVLFVTCGIAKVRLERLIRRVWPFLLWQIAVLLVVTYMPFVALAVPRLFGYYR